jgi:hypothetical protein
MSQKEVVGCRRRRYSRTTTCGSLQEWKEGEEGSVHSVGHVGGRGGDVTDLGDSWASGQVDGIGWCPVISEGR